MDDNLIFTVIVCNNLFILDPSEKLLLYNELRFTQNSKQSCESYKALGKLCLLSTRLESYFAANRFQQKM